MLASISKALAVVRAACAGRDVEGVDAEGVEAEEAEGVEVAGGFVAGGFITGVEATQVPTDSESAFEVLFIHFHNVQEAYGSAFR